MSAQDLGKTLLAEIEEVGLDEILDDHHRQGASSTPSKWFNSAALDDLLTAIVNAQATISTSTTTTSAQRFNANGPPIIEITSTAPGAGKTHLLYHLISRTILPLSHGGKQACAVLLDLDGNFSVLRLAQQMLSEISLCRREQQRQAHQEQRQELETETATDPSDHETVRTALHHLHILHPQSLPATIAQLRGLSSYLMNSSAHPSFERTVGLLALDSVSAFYWQTRAEAEDAALLTATTQTNTGITSSAPGYGELATTIRDVQKEFRCPVVITSRHIPGGSGSSQKAHAEGSGSTGGGLSSGLASKLPTLPRIWLTSLPAIRLLVRRSPVRRVPVTATKLGGVSEARRESEKRQLVVDRGRFECILGLGLGVVEERALAKVRSLGKDGFNFWVGTEGIRFARDDSDDGGEGTGERGPE